MLPGFHSVNDRGGAPWPVSLTIPTTVNGANVTELLVVPTYTIPRPNLPYFESGKESDFILLKMALDSLLCYHGHLSEQNKFQVLLDRLKLASALKLAKYDTRPYTPALSALNAKYWQPRQLVQCEIGNILNAPHVRAGVDIAFQEFSPSNPW